MYIAPLGLSTLPIGWFEIYLDFIINCNVMKLKCFREFHFITNCSQQFVNTIQIGSNLVFKAPLHQFFKYLFLFLMGVCDTHVTMIHFHKLKKISEVRIISY